MTDYDLIALEYKHSKLQPWRRHIESFTLFGLLGDLAGKSVLDLACGEGFYSRLLKHHGAARVVGVDYSPEMIELARTEEAKAPLGIDYRVGDAKELALGECFDVVLAAYLLNYAATPDDLLKMCEAVARHLKPGGRFVGANNNPDESPEHFATSRKYGFVKRMEGDRREGAPIIYTIYVKDASFELTNYYLSLATHEWALRQAGLREMRWQQPQLSPAGAAEFGEDFWADFLNDPPVIFFECCKSP